MSKFLTPPVWYDKSGNLVEILTGNISYESGTAIGKASMAFGNYSVAIGTNALATDDGAIAIGYGSDCNIQGGIVIGTLSRLSYRDPGTDASIVIGNAGEMIGHGNIAIGEKIKIGSADFDSTENIVIGSNSAVYGYGCIVIGGGIQLGRETLGGDVSDIIQIGSSDKTYSAQIGDGNGILKCICSKAQTTSFTNTEWIQSVKDNIDRPYAYLDGDVPATYQVVAFSSADSTNCMASTIIYFEGSAGGAATTYHQTFRVDTGYTSSDTNFRHVSKDYAVHIVPTSGQGGTWTMWVVYTSPNSGDFSYLGFKYRRIA